MADIYTDVIKFITVEKELRSTWITAFDNRMDYFKFINRQIEERESK